MGNSFFGGISNRNLLFVWIGVCLLFGWYSWPVYNGQSLDYALYYSIGELFSAGQGLDIYVTGEQGPWYGYPAIVAPIFNVLQWIPLTESRHLFFGLKILVFCFWPFLLGQCASDGPSKTKAYVIAGIVMITVFPAIFEEVIVGNINTFLLTLAFAAFALTRYGYVTTGAAMITFISAFKPQYSLFFLPGLFFAPLRAIAGGVISLSALTGLAVSQFGWQGFIKLMARWGELMSNPLAGPNDVNNMSTSGVFGRLLAPLGLTQSGSLQGVNLFSFSLDNAMMIGRVLVAVLVVGMIVSMARRWKLFPKERFLEFYSGICLITLLVTPVIWLTHYMFLVLPMFGLGKLLFRTSPKLVGCLILLNCGALFLAGQMLNNPPATTVLARTYGLPYYALMAAAVIFIFAKREVGDAA